MSNKAYSVINDYYPGGNTYMNSFKNLFEENDLTLSKRLNKDVELIIINNSHIINK